MDLQLDNKTVLVTGAGQGLGRALGEAFAEEGAKVAFHYNTSATGAEEAVAKVRAGGGSAIGVGADLRDRTSVEAAVGTIVAELGPIDVLVNNAAATQSKPFLETTEDDWQPQIDITAEGTIRLCHIVARQMVDNGGGAIVNLMGDSGRVGESRLLITSTSTRATPTTSG